MPRPVAGEVHLTSIHCWNQKKLVNVASASLPAFDKDPRPRYSIFTWIGTGWEVEQILVEYDYRREVAALAECGLPNRQDYAKNFPQ